MSQSETYGATDKQNASLKLLQKLGAVDFFDVQQQTNMRWQVHIFLKAKIGQKHFDKLIGLSSNDLKY
jgi:hypothetical protein